MMLLLSLTMMLTDPVVVSFGKLKSPCPAVWKSEKPANRLRSHQFRLPSSDKEFANAELIILPESNPDPAKSQPGWQKTFDPPDGKTMDDVVKKETKKYTGFTVHKLDVSGTWNYRERPLDPKSKLEVRPEYRAIWLIVVVGDDAWHVRLSGPQKVIAAHEKEFQTWFESFK